MRAWGVVFLIKPSGIPLPHPGTRQVPPAAPPRPQLSSATACPTAGKPLPVQTSPAQGCLFDAVVVWTAEQGGLCAERV